MKTGEYARTKKGIIGKLIIKEDTIAVAKWQGNYELQDITTYTIGDTHFYKNDIIKSSPNIEDLICVGDLIYVDIEPEYRPEYYEGIVVPRIIETLEEGEDYYMKIKYNKYVLKGILTKEQVENGVYWVNE